MSNRTWLTLGLDSQPKNGQIVIMLYAFQDILAKYLNSHLPVIVETTIRQSGKLDIPLAAADIIVQKFKSTSASKHGWWGDRRRASVLVGRRGGGAIKIGPSWIAGTGRGFTTTTTNTILNPGWPETKTPREPLTNKGLIFWDKFNCDSLIATSGYWSWIRGNCQRQGWENVNRAVIANMLHKVKLKDRLDFWVRPVLIFEGWCAGLAERREQPWLIWNLGHWASNRVALCIFTLPPVFRSQTALKSHVWRCNWAPFHFIV